MKKLSQWKAEYETLDEEIEALQAKLEALEAKQEKIRQKAYTYTEKMATAEFDALPSDLTPDEW